MRLTFEAADPKHLQHVLTSIRKVPGVYDIFRVSQAGIGIAAASGRRMSSRLAAVRKQDVSESVK